MDKTIAVLVIAGAAVMALNGCSMNSYQTYSSKDPQINVRADFPRGWEFSESRGEKGRFAQVTFYAKKAEGAAADAVMAITSYPEEESGATAVIDFASKFIEKRGHFKDCQVLSKIPAMVAGNEAIDVTFSYKLISDLNKVNAVRVPTLERAVTLKKNGRFYVVRYQNSEAQFEKLEKAFDRLLASLTFK